MSTIPESKIEELARQKLDGKSYSSIREELSESGLSAEEIRTLIRKVDERVLGETAEQGSLNRAQQWYRIGLVVAIAGLILSIAFNAGLILQRFRPWLVYSPFIAGILLMFYGRILQRKKQVPEDRRPGAIRNKRPYT